MFNKLLFFTITSNPSKIIYVMPLTSNLPTRLRGQIELKLNENGKTGIFKISFQYILALRAKMY